MNSEYYQVTQKGGFKLSPSNKQFIHHSLLPPNTTTINTEYLQDDCLLLRVRTVTDYTSRIFPKSPSWQNPHSVSQSLCEFTLSEFSKRKQSNNAFYSPPFYTHQHGYKLCLGVNANGVGAGKDTHISVYVSVMAGNSDDQLQWPFTGDIDFELLNWRKDEGHHQMTISVNKDSDIYQVTEGTIGRGYGLYCVLPHSFLSYNSITNTEYLQNDCLRLRVSKVVVYSPPLLVKIPSWQQDPHNVSQSMCEFTLSEFAKRKQSNNSFDCPPFYTHQNGYKFCIRVFSNGVGDGMNTHISVYIDLMAGENDDQLQWPFVGDVVIELLNWKENRKHHQRTISIEATSDFTRVVQGDYGPSLGYDQFISHSSLSYNSTTDTEYLQDDCLRLRVSMTK